MAETASFGAWMRHRRRELDLTQEELARRVGCARITIRKLEAEQLRPSRQMAELLAVQLGVPGGDRQDFIRFARLQTPEPATRDIPTLHNLPVQLSSFIGRERDLAELHNLLKDHRLVTVTGAGGTGKTRLALELATRLLDDFADGVWFVELAPLANPQLVPNVVASVLHVQEQQGRPVEATLLEWLGGREMLLVIDNCEHLIEACAHCAEASLRAGRGSRILTTSREALGVAGESTYYLPSLESPGPTGTSRLTLDELMRFAAVRLFCERSREALASFTLTEANAPDVAQVCNHLDGIPLAIELAAARVNVLSVAQIAARLDDRFRLLTGGTRTDVPRHQTLRSLIDWSYSLLSDPERIIFGRLSVFAGGWTLEAAEQVCAGGGIDAGDILDLLTHLVDKSLVAVDHGPKEPRYRMLETIRQYAQEELSESGELSEVRSRHLDFISDLAASASANTYYAEEPLWNERLELELGNLRAAVQWALDLPDPEPALRLAASVNMFCVGRGHIREGLAWLTASLEMPSAARPAAARAAALEAKASLLSLTGDFAAALPLLEESVSISRETKASTTLAEALLSLGWAECMLGDYQTAHRHMDEGHALSHQLSHRSGLARSLCGFGDISTGEGDLQGARRHYEASSRLLREIGNRGVLALLNRRVGHIAVLQGEHDVALALCCESLSLNLELGDRRGTAASLAALAAVATAQDRTLRAAHLYGAAEALLQSIGVALQITDHLETEFGKDAARLALGEETYSRAYNEGYAMSLDEAIEFALATDRE